MGISPCLFTLETPRLREEGGQTSRAREDGRGHSGSGRQSASRGRCDNHGTQYSGSASDPESGGGRDRGRTGSRRSRRGRKSTPSQGRSNTAFRDTNLRTRPESPGHGRYFSITIRRTYNAAEEVILLEQGSRPD